MDEATKIIELIETYDHRGSGVKDDPYRIVKQWWSLDGKLLIEFDTPYEKKPYTIMNYPLGDPDNPYRNLAKRRRNERRS